MNNSFSPNSRYFDIGTRKTESPSGKTIVYLQRRFVPLPERFELLQEHSVVESDRLDNITAKYLDDSEQFWRICDANRAMHPDDLIQIGRKLRITLPEGVPGVRNA